MGRHAEVFDTEMLARLRGQETATMFQQAMLEGNRTQARIAYSQWLLIITTENPSLSQWISQNLVETTTQFLDKNRRASVEIVWVLGHMGIAGNDRADIWDSKEATKLEPITETTTLANLY